MHPNETIHFLQIIQEQSHGHDHGHDHGHGYHAAQAAPVRIVKVKKDLKARHSHFQNEKL